MADPAVDDIITEIRAIKPDTLKDNADSRAKLLAAAQALCIRLETPFEFVQRITWQEPSFLMCLKVADGIGLFEEIGSEDARPKTTKELAIATNVEPKLLKRIARHLAARDILKYGHVLNS